MKFVIGDEIYVGVMSCRMRIIAVHDDSGAVALRMNDDFQAIGVPEALSSAEMESAQLCAVADFDACMWRMRTDRGDPDAGILNVLTVDEVKLRRERAAQSESKTRRRR